MIYLTKNIKKTLKAFKKAKRVVLGSPNEREIFHRLMSDPDTHIIISMNCTDVDATAVVLSQWSGIDVKDISKIIFDAGDKKSLVKDLSKHSDEIYAKIDKKIEKAKEKCENTSELRDKRGELYDVIEGNADKIDTLKIHAKYRKLPKSLIKKIKKVKTVGEVGEIR